MRKKYTLFACLMDPSPSSVSVAAIYNNVIADSINIFNVFRYFFFFSFFNQTNKLKYAVAKFVKCTFK